MSAGRRTMFAFREQSMIQPQRISPLNLQARRPGRYVLYWMQAAQRARCNHALEYAIRQANTLNVPVVAFFGLTDSFPSANIRHYHFMLQGLKQVQQELHQRGIALARRVEGAPPFPV